MKLRIFLTLLFCGVSALAQDKFPYSVTDMPFNARAVHRGIDTGCSDNGGAAPGPRQEQNKAKNNFGASGTAVVIRVTDIDLLERASIRARNCAARNGANCKRLDLAGGIPEDREQLKAIATSSAGNELGEGTLVSLEAKVLDSHYSNTQYNRYGNAVGSGESVNCGNNKVDWNDVHIVLAAPGVTDECLSVTAEISPHYRPTAWRRFHKMSGPINNVAKRVDFSKIQMVRITGPLFYDASHDPCSVGKNGKRIRTSPARRSIWEIHPVYTLEVKVGGQWQSFEDWAATQ